MYRVGDETIGENEKLDPTGFLQGCKQKRYSAKDVVYRESEGPGCVYVVRSGLIKLLSYLSNGRARIVRLHGKSHWFGLEALLKQPYEHTAIAIGDVVVDQVSIASLNTVERNDPRQYNKVLRQWHNHLAQADMWISDFSTGGIKTRVARLVEFLSELEYGNDRVELLTVHEMADILGVTPESVSRILAGFKRNDVLNRESDPSKEIYHIDTDRLEAECDK